MTMTIFVYYTSAFMPMSGWIYVFFNGTYAHVSELGYGGLWLMVVAAKHTQTIQAAQDNLTHSKNKPKEKRNTISVARIQYVYRRSDSLSGFWTPLRTVSLPHWAATCSLIAHGDYLRTTHKLSLLGMKSFRKWPRHLARSSWNRFLRSTTKLRFSIW